VASTKIITDSASDLPEEIAQQLKVTVVPLTIRFGTEEFVDRVDLDPAAFWAKCASSATLPETAAPSPGAFSQAFADAAAEGADGVVCITLSSRLSATYQSALAAAETATIPVRVVDSEAVTMAQGLLTIAAAEAAAAGQGTEEIAAMVEAARARTGVEGTLETLEHLKKGGRIGSAQALFGSVLSIKPILALKDGLVAEDGRQRTRAKALDHVAKVAAEHGPFERLAVVHGAADDCDKLLAKIEGFESDTAVITGDIGSVVGTHGGPGIIGICWISRG